MVSKKRGREFTVQVLYQQQFSDYDTHKVFDLFWKVTKADKGTQNYTEALAEAILDKANDLDMEITAYLKNWTLDRIATMDHIILRIAFYEFIYRPEVPWKVVVSEAINLTKAFSDEKSVPFINGILHAWASKNRPADVEANKNRIAEVEADKNQPAEVEPDNTPTDAEADANEDQ